MRTTIFSLLFLVSSFAHAITAQTLVCKTIDDIREVIDAHATRSEKEAQITSVAKVFDGQCAIMKVELPDNPRHINVSYGNHRGTEFFIAVPVEGDMFAFVYLVGGRSA